MSSLFGEPPSGIDLSADQMPKINATVIAMCALAAIAVALRFFAKIRVQRSGVAEDDWFILASLPMVYGILVCTILAGRHGLGKHVWAVGLDDVTTLMKILFAYILIYFLTIPLIKLSIICFYRRIFGMNWGLWLCTFLAVGYPIACYIAFLVACDPPSYYWTQYKHPESGMCRFDLYPFYIGNAAVNVTTDFMVLIIPIPLVWRLQMHNSVKIMVSSVFILGLFACVASILRIYFMTALGHSADVSWVQGNAFIWSIVEPCVGIICACLPAIRALVRSTFKCISSSVADKFGSSGEGRPSKYGQHSTSNGYRRHNSLEAGSISLSKPRLRPDDEIMLTTTMADADADSTGKGTTSAGEESDGGPFSIQVRRDFHWKEDSR